MTHLRIPAPMGDPRAAGCPGSPGSRPAMPSALRPDRLRPAATDPETAAGRAG